MHEEVIISRLKTIQTFGQVLGKTFGSHFKNLCLTLEKLRSFVMDSSHFLKSLSKKYYFMYQKKFWRLDRLFKPTELCARVCK